MPNEDKKTEDVKGPELSGEISNVVEKIKEAESVLVTLSKDPRVDDIAAAMGLTMALSNMGKHTTAIYSGKTPNTLEFLKPEETFETDTNSLQDFIIALSKEKADHLRYKIEGDFVKVYITPFKTTINESDLEFSHGDVNVDLVISMNVKDEADLDAALSEHGRILHDAEVINITNDVESGIRGTKWNDAAASSLSEMVVKLMDALSIEITKEVATALLTGIEAATDRFSNEKTTSEAMAMSSRLMNAGADQQLIVSNITKETPVETASAEEVPTETIPVGAASNEAPAEVAPNDTVLNVASGGATSEKTPEQELENMIAAAVPEVPAMPEIPTEPENPVELEKPGELGTLNEPEKTISPEASIGLEKPAESEMRTELPVVEAPAVEPAAVSVPKVPVNEIYQAPADMVNMQDGVMAPVEVEKPKDYGAMMEEELASSEPEMNPAISATPAMPVAQPMMGEQPAAPVEPAQPIVLGSQPMGEQPAIVPDLSATPNVEPVPQPVATPDLPPAPVPDVSNMTLPPVQPIQPGPVQSDESSLEGMPATADGNSTEAPAEPVNPVVVQPDPTAFHIPGM